MGSFKLRGHVKALLHKLSDKRGDTLVEALAAILIAALGASLLATMVMVSTNVAMSSKQALKAAYAAESEVSAKKDEDSQTVKVALGDKVEGIAVEVYSSDGTFLRYEDASKASGS